MDTYSYVPNKSSSSAFTVNITGGDSLIVPAPKSYFASLADDYYSVTSTPAEADAIAASRPGIYMMNLRANTHGYGPAAYKPVGR
jgi:hypothetical protein